METDLEWIVKRLNVFLQDDTTALENIKELVSDVKADLGWNE
jgi:hypothetical protein